MSLLRTAGISVNYGKISAVRNLTIDMKPGRIVTIIGPNGAGKSTFLKALMGLLPYRGSADFLDRPLERQSVQDRVRSGMALVPETRELFGQMSVWDNLRLGAFSRKGASAKALRADLAMVTDLFPRLAERRLQAAGTLSGGERQMLALGRALMARPKLLMLDEPSLGLAPIVVREIFRVLANLRDMNVSILLVEQNARAALRIADYGYVLETGDITLSGEASDLQSDSRILKTYLGGSAE
ncbi:High-affinity branched-chain amino acid transport ATP-binding protein LivF [Chelatococcus asaccharovorans]|uniref:Amino acid/amide ABC transporter ATP-binding protein 2 (HAAT family) n=2 Tax=Chelatococcus asaccharovorans TaxID=28210 RepID=A0A2V3TUQ9_9HYPH|nr:ABC transporter ATP-binding protein [Chelatococcus asaccharovorans]MBS7706119.1 ABC transporter ATP-binding protein [Chelatococcus asaccharovorans]PXW52489.1 amino acid/amide ABC transporter ATP-binding protein 2 (HAAT family) [Chelatococcus asaccharovorans]CAH1659457.1 High-affinity branched-chain amino acid transport ATP-binding protein LivF [Chelatococcus asaccharovorans]CAH1687931.1 High-affinity branched-chain amino acid transport ATP-binding protein LivF [Chelatococcus asaccharovorans]